MDQPVEIKERHKRGLFLKALAIVFGMVDLIGISYVRVYLENALLNHDFNNPEHHKLVVSFMDTNMMLLISATVGAGIIIILCTFIQAQGKLRLLIASLTVICWILNWYLLFEDAFGVGV